ncbi:hypothetical protein VNO78_11798 [Psophocarpus tetragonolobus]|uniref:Uncharacterized protein n=1 Tax=Psophocarpus tetragonolobus TaxID=3891 RepID=A0AAN9SUW3_PSOTE
MVLSAPISRMMVLTFLIMVMLRLMRALVIDLMERSWTRSCMRKTHGIHMMLMMMAFLERNVVSVNLSPQIIPVSLLPETGVVPNVSVVSVSDRVIGFVPQLDYDFIPDRGTTCRRRESSNASCLTSEDLGVDVCVEHGGAMAIVDGNSMERDPSHYSNNAIHGHKKKSIYGYCCTLDVERHFSTLQGTAQCSISLGPVYPSHVASSYRLGFSKLVARVGLNRRGSYGVSERDEDKVNEEVVFSCGNISGGQLLWAIGKSMGPFCIVPDDARVQSLMELETGDRGRVSNIRIEPKGAFVYLE